MLYLLKNVKIFEASNSRGLYHWLQAELLNDKNIRMNGERRVYYSTSEDECKMYIDAGCVTKNIQESSADITVYDVNDTSLKEAIKPGGKLEDYGDVRHINAVKVTWPLNGVWAQVYRQDVVDDKGVLLHKKGDMRVTETGQIMEFRELSFYLATDIDTDTKERIYSQDPQRVANRVLERGYVKLEEVQATTPQVAAPAQPTAPATPTPQPEMTPEQLQAQIAALQAKLAGG